jgi:hypothetical protein
MSIRKAVAWLFDVGDGSEVAALKAAQRRERQRDARRREAGEVHLYGEAEAIRVLYQTASLEESPPKPPRPKRGRGLWVARYVDSLTSALSDRAAAKA